jgi:hypothetical protein
MTRDTRNTVASAAALLLLAGLLFLAFRAIDDWAAGAFARPLMGAALVAVLELGLLLLALGVAPVLSRLLRLLLGGAPAPSANAPATDARDDDAGRT